MKKIYGFPDDLRSDEIIKLAKDFAHLPESEIPKEIEFQKSATKIIILKGFDVYNCFKKYKLLPEPEKPQFVSKWSR